MARKYLDCRELPNTVGCTLRIAGEEGELLEESVRHGVAVHSERDTPEFRAILRSMMKPEETTSPSYTTPGRQTTTAQV